MSIPKHATIARRLIGNADADEQARTRITNYVKQAEEDKLALRTLRNFAAQILSSYYFEKAVVRMDKATAEKALAEFEKALEKLRESGIQASVTRMFPLDDCLGVFIHGASLDKEGRIIWSKGKPSSTRG